MNIFGKMISKIVILILRTYQLIISPILGPSCRFYPSCSQYAIESLRTHGFLRGSYFTIHRVLRCNPACEGGLDPVPEKVQKNNHQKNNTDSKKHSNHSH